MREVMVLRIYCFKAPFLLRGILRLFLKRED